MRTKVGGTQAFLVPFHVLTTTFVCSHGLGHPHARGRHILIQPSLFDAAPRPVLLKLTTVFGTQELYAPAPRLWLRPQRAADIAPPPSYACPLYRTPERRGVLATTGHSTNFIMLIRLPTPLPPVHWTLRGAALLCHRPE